MRSIPLFATFFAGLATGLFAASTTSTILGTVTDPSGALVAHATVTVRSETTNFSHEAVSSSEGDFVIPNLDPGPYTVTVQASGFRQFVRTGMDLTVDQRLRVDASLTVGDVSEKVEEAGQVQLVNTDSTSN